MYLVFRIDGCRGVVNSVDGKTCLLAFFGRFGVPGSIRAGVFPGERHARSLPWVVVAGVPSFQTKRDQTESSAVAK